MAELYESIIVGGGIAGLQAAIQLGRYKHNVLVLDAREGRSSLCQAYHNILGWPDGVSGMELREKGYTHAKRYGVKFLYDRVTDITRADDFQIKTESGLVKRGKTLLVATGIKDRFPPIEGLVHCLGLSVYVCPDCDGYEVSDQMTVVIGSGRAGAEMCLALTYWTQKLIYINHEKKELGSELEMKLLQNGIRHLQEPVERIRHQNGRLEAVLLENGDIIDCAKGFIAFGHNKVFSDLVRKLGVELEDNRHIPANPRTKETNVPQLWVAGDIGVHSEQVTIAMGEGSQAAIWMHKALLNMARAGHSRPSEPDQV